jgi:4-hydroxy-tetrahydrodipicolinate synthase
MERTIGGFIPPIPTPMLNGGLDFASLHRLLDFLGDNVTGVLVAGSTGEVASLTVEERIALMREVRSVLDPKSVLAVSISDNSVENSRRLVAAATEVEADMLVVSCPNYFPNDGRMLEEYFALIGAMASAPLCLYDNPFATNTFLSVGDVKVLADHGGLRHVKVTDRLVDKVAELRRETDLTVHAGDDSVLWHQLAGGAHGAMTAIPLIRPEQSRALWEAFSAGELDTAYSIYRELAHVINICLSSNDYVQVVKLVMHERGIIESPEVRLPLVPLGPERSREVREASDLRWLEDSTPPAVT